MSTLPTGKERNAGFFTTFSEQEKHDKLYNQPSLYLSWITQVVKDVSRSFDLLVAERGIDPKRVALWSNSRGAIAGSIAAGQRQRVGPGDPPSAGNRTRSERGGRRD